MDSVAGYTAKMKADGKHPLYSVRSIIKGINDPRYEKLRALLKKYDGKKNIKIYSYDSYEPDEIKSQAELKKHYNYFVDCANYAADHHQHDCTEMLLQMIDPNRITRQEDQDWPFYTMCNDIDWDKGWATCIILVKKEDPNY